MSAKRDKEIQVLVDSLRETKEQQDLVKLRRQQRRHAKIHPLRDYISFEEEQTCISLVDNVDPDPFVAARTKIAFII